MLASLGTLIDQPDGQLRASLVVAQLIGIAMLRHVVKVDAVVRASNDELVSLVAPVIEGYLRHYMDESRADQLRVPGARLYYEVQGTGPLLLMLQGGDGDADAMDALAKHLVEGYTVLSYDRGPFAQPARRSGRSRRSDDAHSDDASRLLHEVTSEPVLVFGASLGAMLGLDLVARHPRAGATSRGARATRYRAVG